MSVDEAEDVVQKLGEAGMLSLQEGVVDATTPAGQQRWKEIEEEGRSKAAADAAATPNEVGGESADAAASTEATTTATTGDGNEDGDKEKPAG